MNHYLSALKAICWSLALYVSVLFGGPTAANAQVYVFYSDGNTLKFGLGSGGTPATIASAGNLVTAVALDPVNDKVYYASMSNGGSLSRIDLDGSNQINVFTNLGVAVFGVALDIANQHIYYTVHSNSGSVRRINFDGTGNVTLISGLDRPTGIDLDLTNSKMYFAVWGAGDIVRADLDGSNAETLVNGVPESNAGVAVNPSLGKIYFTDFADAQTSAGSIIRADLNGSNATPIVQSLSAPYSMAIHLGTGKLYFAEIESGKVFRCDLDGGNLEIIAQAENLVYGIAVQDGLAIPTATPPASATNTPTPTPQATATPTSTPSEPSTAAFSIHATDKDGNSLAGAIVTIDGVGSFISDQTGKVVVKRAPRHITTGQSLSVVISKDGYTFPTAQISLGERIDIPASGKTDDHLASCSKTQLAARRTKLSSALTKLYLTAEAAMRAALESSQKTGNRDFVNQFKRYQIIIRKTLRVVQQQELSIPTSSVQCLVGIAQCSKVSLEGSLARLRRSADLYLLYTSHTTQSKTNQLVGAPNPPRFLERARRHYRNFLRAEKAMPQRVGICR